jgi:hypothetical protein
MDYEAALERQFEMKVQQLVAWRRAKGRLGTSELVSIDKYVISYYIVS